VHLERSKFRAYANRSRLGDFTETDGQLLMAASRTPTAKAAFRGLDT
jgi:hypothetical protein